MIGLILAFLAGDVYLQTFASLPSPIFLGLSVVLSSALCFYFKKQRRYLWFLFAFVLGFCFTAWVAQAILSWTLPKEVEGKPLLITGTVASLPNTEHTLTRFLFSLEKWQTPDHVQAGKTLLRLVWSHPTRELRVGDRWQLRVKLKRIHGMQSPGAFDYEAWALQKGLRASGYVVASAENQWLSHQTYHYPILEWRQRLQENIQAHLPLTPTAPWLLALMVGERNGIAQTDWQVLRHTGTNHLMAIGGLHIGIMSGFAHKVVMALWRRLPTLVLALPAQEAGAIAALCIALFYGACAGFSIPTQRACLMLSVFMMAVLSRRKIPAFTAWSLALLAVLIINPLSVLTDSFWLSFATIALIIYGMQGRLAHEGLWWKWGRVQWVIGLGLIPLTLLLFQECSLASFLANTIAIPWLGVLILPFCFLAGVFLFISPPIAEYLLILADKSLAGLWVVLSQLSSLPYASWSLALPHSLLFLITAIGVVVLLLPNGLPGRWLGLLFLFPLALYEPAKLPPQNVNLTLLDVGQGLSVVVETRHHTLIYDTGPSYSTQMNMGESIVLPYLRSRRIKQIDMLVVSHGDNDHIGGANAILQAMQVIAIKTSVPEKLPFPHTTLCLAQQSWQWDGVQFTFLHPTQDQLHLGNDSSCVLRIDNGEQSILLTGDIEKPAEKILLKSPFSLHATLLTAPHHGSKSSGMPAFIQAVHPQMVLYATGYRNRYHFPHPSVAARYTEIHAQSFNTAEGGTIQFQIEQGKPLVKGSLYRVIHRRYWMDNGSPLSRG